MTNYITPRDCRTQLSIQTTYLSVNNLEESQLTQHLQSFWFSLRRTWLCNTSNNVLLYTRYITKPDRQWIYIKLYETCISTRLEKVCASEGLCHQYRTHMGTAKGWCAQRYSQMTSTRSTPVQEAIWWKMHGNILQLIFDFPRECKNLYRESRSLDHRRRGEKERQKKKKKLLANWHSTASLTHN